MKKNSKQSKRRVLPNTEAMLARRIDAVHRNVINTLVGASHAATWIEGILSDPETKEDLRYALRALLVELSNESGVNVDTPGIAGTFYRVAALELNNSQNIHVQQTFRHLDVLLTTPTVKTAKTLIKYWDDHRSKSAKVDPFPAKPDPFAATKRKPRDKR